MTMTEKQIDEQLATEPFHEQQFREELRRQTKDALRRPSQAPSSLRKLAPMAAVLILTLGAGIFFMPHLEQRSVLPSATGDTIETATPSHSAEPAEDKLLLLAATDDGHYRLYADRKDELDGTYNQVYVEGPADILRKFDWTLDDYGSTYNPTLKLLDVTEDGVAELVILTNRLNAGGLWTQEAHVLHTSDLSEIALQDPGAYLEPLIQKQVLRKNGYLWVTLKFNETVHEIAVDPSQEAAWEGPIDFSYVKQYQLHESGRWNRLDVEVGVYIGSGDYKIKIGTINVPYRFESGKMVVEEQFLGGLFIEQPIDGEVPTFAIQIGEKYISLWDTVNGDGLEALLGKPLKDKTKQLDGYAGTFAGTYHRVITYEGLELTLHSGDGEEYRVTSIRVQNDQWRSSFGVRVGDTVQQVEAAYPSIEVAKDGRNPPRDFAYVVGGFAISLMIDFKDGNVHELYFEYLMD